MDLQGVVLDQVLGFQVDMLGHIQADHYNLMIERIIVIK